MVFFFITMLISAVIIYVGASLLEWILGKVASGFLETIGPTWASVATVAVVTAIYLFVMTRPAVVGPYEQWTFENIGGQAIAGVLVMGLKVFTGGREEAGA